MRTTLDLDDALLAQAKAQAAREHISLTRLIEEGLSLRLRAQRMDQSDAPEVVIPAYAGRGGLQPTIHDTLSQRALFEAADALEPSR